MRRPTAAAALAVAALLAAPPAALAKGVAAARVCGANGCHSVEHPDRFEDDFATATAARPRRAEPFFTIRLRARVASGKVAEVYALDWLPRAGLTRGYCEHAWTRPGPRLERALRAAARGLRPLPAARLGSVAAPTARVVETFAPASDDDRTPTTLALAGAGVLLLAALGAKRHRLRATPR